ncbi:BN159_2729 family protein, partial [Streptomyces sp. NPDC003233]
MTQEGSIRAAATVIRECFANFEAEVAVRLALALDTDTLSRLCSGVSEEEREPQSARACDTVILRQAPALAGQPDAEPVNSLEAEAVAWQAKCAQAKDVWAALGMRFHGHRPEVMAIEWDRDRVVVCVKAVSLADWYFWLAVIGAPVDADTRQAGYAQLAFGQLDGVPVHLVAHDVPRLLSEAWDAAREPYFLWGRVYDLARPLTDRNGVTWHHHRFRPKDHVPLLRRDGDDEPSALTYLIRETGPLTAATDHRGPDVAAGAVGCGLDVAVGVVGCGPDLASGIAGCGPDPAAGIAGSAPDLAARIAGFAPDSATRVTFVPDSVTMTAGCALDPAAGIAGSAPDPAYGTAGCVLDPAAGIAGSVPDPLGGIVGSVPDSVGGVAGCALDPAAGIAGSVPDPPGGIVGSVPDSVGGAAGCALDSAAGIAGSVPDPLGGIVGSVPDSVGGVAGCALD